MFNRSCKAAFNPGRKDAGLLVVLISSILAGPALASDDDDRKGLFMPNGPAKNFYAGIGLGINNNNTPDAWQDGSVTSFNSDKSGIPKKITFGYQINDNFAVEAGYHDLGKSSLTGVSDGSGVSWAPGPIAGTQEAKGWELGVMGRWPISTRWYALGYVGMYWWESKEFYNESGFTSSLKESGSSVSYALGFEYDIGKPDRWVYRFMGSHHEVGNDDYDVNGVNAQIIWRFH